MKTYFLTYALLLITTVVNADEPATGPSGTICESPGGSCKGLPDGVLIAYENNCTKFIQCQQGCGCDKICPPGLHFNVKQQICDWPSNAGCDPSYVAPATGPSGLKCESSGELCKNMNDGTFFPNPNDCNMYWECLMGCEINRQCPAGTHFSEKYKRCTWPSEAGCDSSPGSFQPSPSSPGTGPPGSNCESSGESCIHVTDGTLLASSNDSTLYVECSSGCEISRKCPSGSYFCQKLQKCIWSSEAGCDSSSKPPDPGDGSSGSNCDSSGDSCKNIMDGILIASPNDSTIYVECSSGCEISRKCPSGSYFCQKLQKCIWSSEAGCDSSSKPPGPGDGSSGSNCDSSGDSCKNIMDGTLIASPNDSTIYVECASGCEINRKCPSGSHFCQKLQKCIWSSGSGCDSSSNPPGPGDGSSGTNCDSSGDSCKNIMDGILIASPNDSTIYVECSSGCEINRKCPSGSHFCQKLQKCIWSSGSGCDSSSIPPGPGDGSSGSNCDSSGDSCKNIMDGILIASPNDSTIYVECSSGCEINRKCPSGSHFCQKLQKCIWSSGSGCDSSSKPPGPGNGSSGSNCDSSGDSCKNIMDGTLLASPNDSTIYVECSSGCEINRKCPSGSHFCQKLQKCIWSSGSGCDSSSKPPGPGNGSSGSNCDSSGDSCKNIMDGTLLASPNDSTIYVECSSGCEINRKCPPGSHFCQKLQKCIWSSGSGCDSSSKPPGPGNGSSGSNCDSSGDSCKNIMDGILIASPNDSTIYVECSSGCEINRKCPSGSHFCQKLQKCIWSSGSGCDSSSKPPGPGNGSSGSNCDSSGDSCKNIMDGILIASPNDSTIYVECSSGCEINRKCPSGSHFCQKLQKCIWSSGSGCDSSSKPPAPGDGSSGSNCDSLGDSCKNIMDGILLASPNDSTIYVECSSGCEINRKCPSGSHFCQKLQKCTWSSGSGCDSSSNPPGPGNGSSGSNCDLQPSPSSPCTSQCPTPSQPEIPNKKPTEAPYKRPSPKPSPSQPLNPSTKPTPRPNQNSCSGQESGKLLPFIGDCKKFIACDGDGTSYIMHCGSNLHFNAVSESCDWPQYAGCDPSYVQPNNPSCQSEGASCYGIEDGKLLPYKNRCGWFVACYNNCGYNMACGQGLHFNKYAEVCDWPEDAGCEFEQPPITERTTISSTGLTDSGTRSTASGSTQTTDGGTLSTPSGSTHTTTRKPCQACSGSTTTTTSCSCS